MGLFCTVSRVDGWGTGICIEVCHKTVYRCVSLDPAMHKSPGPRPDQPYPTISDTALACSLFLKHRFAIEYAVVDRLAINPPIHVPIMKLPVIFVFLLGLSLPSQAEQINLECKELARQMVNQLVHEGLLSDSADISRRAKAITINLCTDAEASAQQQHEAGKEQAITDWIWQSRPETRGHKRLKKF